MKTNDEKLNEALKLISKTLEGFKNLPKLKNPELTSGFNDMLWTFDGIKECFERMEKENDLKSLNYYFAQIEKRHIEIKGKYLHFLN